MSDQTAKERAPNSEWEGGRQARQTEVEGRVSTGCGNHEGVPESVCPDTFVYILLCL